MAAPRSSSSSSEGSCSGWDPAVEIFPSQSLCRYADVSAETPCARFHKPFPAGAPAATEAVSLPSAPASLSARPASLSAPRRYPPRVPTRPCGSYVHALSPIRLFTRRTWPTPTGAMDRYAGWDRIVGPLRRLAAAASKPEHGPFITFIAFIPSGPAFLRPRVSRASAARKSSGHSQPAWPEPAHAIAYGSFGASAQA
jgi:hypothetical protein